MCCVLNIGGPGATLRWRGSNSKWRYDNIINFYGGERDQRRRRIVKNLGGFLF